MQMYLRRIVVLVLVALAICAVMFSAWRSDNALLKLVVISGGFGALFILIKKYLFRQ